MATTARHAAELGVGAQAARVDATGAGEAGVARGLARTAVGAPVTLAEIPGCVAALRRTFDGGGTRGLEWRRRQLAGIERLCREREAEIEAGLRADLGKSHFEAYAAEINFCAHEAAQAQKQVARWMAPTRVSTPLVAQPGSAQIHPDPLGVVLIIAPWNYPFQLAVAPLIGALAAGNCAVVKPSEVAPATSAVLARWLPEYVDREALVVVEGGVPETTALLAERFDHIFYTGNGAVARVVMAAAARHLTPVTLELGGKSPTLVDAGVDLGVAARRIAWGKFFNAGQTCVAPDYVLVQRQVHDAFVETLRTTLAEFFGSDPQASADYGRIINTRHHDRLMGLLAAERARGTEVAVGGQGDRATRYLAPTVLTGVLADGAVMADEIFGPILPVLAYDTLDEAIAFINARPKPLALYVFSDDRATQDAITERTSSGGLVFNHCVLHLSVPGLPFGGVGESGMGAYHGRHSFDCFSHRKAVLRKGTRLDPSIMYPPYAPKKVKWLKRLL